VSDKERAYDGYLAASAQLGDRKVLGLLAERWNRKLLAHARRLLGDAEAARDAVQESWTEILRSISQLQDARAFALWAYRIVSRRCARLIDRTRRRRQLEQEVAAQPMEMTEPAPEQVDIAKLREAIRALPPLQRAAVALFYLEELSVAETAVALDVPAGTVKTRLMHARRTLRAVLEGEK
jgi:RNA polymerase sigma-70 factor (ECF subfamily)